MSEEEIERKLAFILDQQASFWAKMQEPPAVNLRVERRLDRLERLFTLGVGAGRRERRARHNLEEKINALIDAQIKLEDENKQSRIKFDAEMVELKETQQQTLAAMDARLESLDAWFKETEAANQQARSEMGAQALESRRELEAQALESRREMEAQALGSRREMEAQALGSRRELEAQMLQSRRETEALIQQAQQETTRKLSLLSETQTRMAASQIEANAKLAAAQTDLVVTQSEMNRAIATLAHAMTQTSLRLDAVAAK